MWCDAECKNSVGVPKWVSLALLVLFAASPVALLACDDDPKVNPAAQPDLTQEIDEDLGDLSDLLDVQETDTESAPTELVFELDSPRDSASTFFDFPFPSDLNTSAQGGPDFVGIDNPRKISQLMGLATSAGDLDGYPALPVAWFRFTGPVAQQDESVVIAASVESPLLLVDVDTSSSERGRLFPVVAHNLTKDYYTATNVLAFAPRPGFVLRPGRTYAFVVRTALGDAEGQPLAVNATFAALAAGQTPSSPRGAEAVALYQPLWETLQTLSIDPSELAGATVFTTANTVAVTAAMGDTILEQYDATIENLAIDPVDGLDHPFYCELHGEMTVPQFQKGSAPFDTEGNFELDADGLPMWQRDETIPVVVTIPRAPMPADGYPLVLYFHGSGGLSNQLVDRGPYFVSHGPTTIGEGPAFVVAQHGFAMAGSAHPVNPERVPGADSLAYLNFNNLKAMRDTFRQGTFEQRLYLEALLRLRIPPATLAACSEATLPTGETDFFFQADEALAMGQSMGGAYTNMVGATEPLIKAVVPTGAGGFWTYFVLETTLLPAGDILPMLMSTTTDLTFMHPLLHMVQSSFDPCEPFNYMPRLGQNPLEGHPVRSVYEPVGPRDSYFPSVIYDAASLAYHHPQAGAVIWNGVQEALALGGLDGVKDYPVSLDAVSVDGTAYTGVLVQFVGDSDGFSDPHDLFAQLEEVKHQYSCFFETFHKTGVAIVPEPAPMDTACEGL